MSMARNAIHLALALALAGAAAAPLRAEEDEDKLEQRLEKLESELSVVRRQLEVKQEEDQRDKDRTGIVTVDTQGFQIRSRDQKTYRLRLRGYVDAMHVTEQTELPDALTILQVGGQPLRPGPAYPTAAQRRQVPYAVPSFFDGIDQAIGESVTTWLALTDSPALVLAQDALVSKIPVWCYGSLAEDDAAWRDLVALPLSLDAMTIFAP